MSVSDYYTQLRERHAGIPARAEEMRQKLIAMGVYSVYVQYDGSGDSGEIQEVTALEEDGKEIEVVGPFEDLENLFYDLLESRHPGWEINDGSQGEFTWELGSNTVVHVHKSRFTDYEKTEHQGFEPGNSGGL